MEIRSSQEFYDDGVAALEREMPVDLVISPSQAEAVRMARHDFAVENEGVARSDGVGEALAEAARSGRMVSFLEFYNGPLSDKVLSSMFDIGITHLPNRRVA